MLADGGNAVELLKQAVDRARRLVETLLAEQADLQACLRIDPTVKAEGLTAIARTIEAARLVAEDAQRALERIDDRERTDSR
jgi:hypothetical protein